MAKVLVVDDNHDFCFALESKLQSMGHRTGHAYDAPSALAALKAEEYEVVFLDVMLPEGNSITAIPDIQSMPGNPSVVVVTASGDTENAERAIRNGAYDYLVKPLKRERLEVLGELIGFTRQLDIQLKTDEDIPAFLETFFQQHSPSDKSTSL